MDTWFTATTYCLAKRFVADVVNPYGGTATYDLNIDGQVGTMTDPNGGGFKGGHIHGATDDFGYRAVAGRVGPGDFHATLLHLLGLNPQRLEFRQGTSELRLTDGQQPGRLVRELLN